MNIAFFLKPKIAVAFLYSDFTVRQSLEKMKHYGYTAIPVVDRDGKYAGTVSEGDFLWTFIGKMKNNENIDRKYLEDTPLKKLIRTDCYKPVKITANTDELLTTAMAQNFIPVVDDSDSFIGIVTRSDIIKQLKK